VINAHPRSGSAKRRNIRLLALLIGLAASSARAEDFERRVPVEPGGTLEVELSTGSIEVETHDLPEVEIDARTSGWAAGGMRFALEHEAGEVRLTGSRLLESPASSRPRGGERAFLALLGRPSHQRRSHRCREEVTGEVEVHTSGGESRLGQIVERSK
jgi:hypothetical protein